MNIKHGEWGIRLYRIWASMKQRCSNINHKQYKDYGGRGITVCQEWANDYAKFRYWALNNGYTNNLEIDRIENNLGYSPNNCQWVTNLENQRKKRNVKLTLEKANEIRVLYDTGNYTMRELGKIYNKNGGDICDIINNNQWRTK